MSLSSTKKIYLFLIIFVLFLGSACQFPGIKKAIEPTITSVPPVVEPVNLSPFQNIGCVWQNENYAVCPEGSIPKKMGCDSLSKPSEYQNLLDQASQFVNCAYSPFLQPTPEEGAIKGLYDSGCAVEVYQRLLTYQDGDYLLIRDIGDLKYYYTPVDSENKAIGYAIAATGFQPRYTFDDVQGFRILVNDLEPTHVETSQDGYEINLFDYQACGCGPHSHIMQRVKISINGDMEILESTPVFENPEDDDLCID